MIITALIRIAQKERQPVHPAIGETMLHPQHSSGPSNPKHGAHNSRNGSPSPEAEWERPILKCLVGLHLCDILKVRKH